MIKIRQSINDLYQTTKQNRRYLHQIPELDFDTIKTSKYISDKLTEYKISLTEKSYAKNSVVGVLKVNNENNYIAFRSDIDALPTKEVNDIDFKSINNNSHACGHDGHMAILLSLALYLSNNRDNLNSNILFIFQPAEETTGGASVMLNNGLFDDYHVKYVFGTHLMGDIDLGMIASKSGPMSARNGEIDIEVIGKSAHGAMPELGNDAIVASSELICRFQDLKSYSENALNKTILTIGQIGGGQVRNVICDHVMMKGTIRSYTDELYLELKENIQKVSKQVSEKYHVEVNSVITDYYLSVNNDEVLNNVLKDALGDGYQEAKPKMIAEDFSFYQSKVPGLFFHTGVRDVNHKASIHDANFNFDEKALLYAIECDIRLLEKLGVLND